LGDPGRIYGPKFHAKARFKSVVTAKVIAAANSVYKTAASTDS
jgi:hypothetical protein